MKVAATQAQQEACGQDGGDNADQELREFMSDMGYVLCDLGHIPDGELASNAEVCAGLLPLKHVYRGTDPEVLLAAILPRLSDTARNPG